MTYVGIALALLSSARISHTIVTTTLACLLDEKYQDVNTLHRSSWQQEVDVLGTGGYKRYDEQRAAYLGNLPSLIMQKYGRSVTQIYIAVSLARTSCNLCWELLCSINVIALDSDASRVLPVDESGDEARTAISTRLKEVKSLGPVGIDIFLGSIQHLFANIAPFLGLISL